MGKNLVGTESEVVVILVGVVVVVTEVSYLIPLTSTRNLSCSVFDSPTQLLAPVQSVELIQQRHSHPDCCPHSLYYRPRVE